MAHIFKYPEKDKKGIIIFTHKEWPLLLNEWASVTMDLKQKFYLGWNQGAWFGHIGMIPDVIDFAMTTDNIMSFDDNGHTLKVPIIDRNFLVDDFKLTNTGDRFYDVILVNRVAKFKNTEKFLYAVRRIFDTGRKINVMMVCPSSEADNHENAHMDIVQKYKDMFSREERRYVNLCKLDKELGFLGMSQKTIAFLLNHSKVLFMGSTHEGTCRAVHEALACGTRIVYYKNHRGALVDYLNDYNSVPFEAIEDKNDPKEFHDDNIDEAVLKALDTYSEFDVIKESEYLYNELSNDCSLERLHSHFKKLYERDGKEYDGKLVNTDELHMRLPAHYLELDWNTNPDTPTADLETVEQLSIFIEHINKNI